MLTSDLEPWPKGDSPQTAVLRGLIRVGLAEAVRSATGEHYRLLPLRVDVLASGFDATRDPAARP